MSTDPGMYAVDGGVIANVDQQRAEIRDALRTSNAFSATVVKDDGTSTHFAICASDNPLPFLIYVCARAIRDALIGDDYDSVVRVSLAAIEEGLAG